MTRRACTPRPAAASSSNFTGIDSPYEVPEHPEVRIDTSATTAEQAADEIIAVLRARSILS